MTQLTKSRRYRLPVGTTAMLAFASILAAMQVPAVRADDFGSGQDRDRRRVEDRHERERREHERERREHERDFRVVPRVVYAPPPVVYAPPPPSEGINLIFPLHIR
jgi:hypothetical protein